MQPKADPTGYARLAPRHARAALLVLAIAGVLLVAVTFSSAGRGNVGKRRPGEGDVALYRAEVERIDAGDGYYHAAAVELTRRGYPTRSVFNWRTPLPMWLIGRLPGLLLGKTLLCFSALAVMLLGFEALAREEGNLLTRPVACVLLMTGPLMPCVLGDLFVMPVLWAGVFIAISICCYALKRPRLGVVFGLAAVFFRELALPYCLLAAALAWRQKRRGELLGWIAGLAAWLIFFGWHSTRVAEWMPPDAHAHAESWMQFAGAGFVISTAQMNAYLLLLPQWITALYLAAAMFGMAGWNTTLGNRVGLTVCLFVVGFAVVGQEFNQYWGCLIGPLLCFGVVRFPASLRDAYRAATAGAVACAN